MWSGENLQQSHNTDLFVQNQCCMKEPPKCHYGWDKEHKKCYESPCEYGYDNEVCLTRSENSHPLIFLSTYKMLISVQKQCCKPKPKDCPWGKKKNGNCKKQPPKDHGCPWGKEDDDNGCRTDCPDKNKCEKEWWGGCKKDQWGIDIPKAGIQLLDWVPPILG
jgi:hypothetical protein